MVEFEQYQWKEQGHDKIRRVHCGRYVLLVRIG